MDSNNLARILNSSFFAFAHHKIITDNNGKPIDYQFIDVNETFEKLTGLNRDSIINKTVKVVMPEIEKDKFDWISFYGNIALKGGNEVFEQFSEYLDRLYLVQVFSIEKGFFSTIFFDITDKKKLESEILQKKIEFRSILSTFPGISYRCKYDEYWTMLYISSDVLRMIGYPPSDFINNKIRSYESVIYCDDSKMVREKVINAINLNIPWIIEYRIVHKDGKIVWVQERGKAVKNSNNFIEYLDGFIIEISEQKQAEENLKIINQELQIINKIISATTTILNTKELLDKILDEALQIVDLEGGTICLIEPDDTLKLYSERNNSEATINELTNNKIKIGTCLCGNSALDKCPLILWDSEDVQKYATREVIRGEKINFHAAYPFVIKDKCVGVLCVFTKTDKKPNLRKLKLLETLASQSALAIENSILFDKNQKEIEARKIKEEELKQSEEIFSQFMTNSPIYVFFKDKNLRAIKLSKNFEQMLQRPINEIIGKKMEELFPLELAKKIIADDQKILNDSKTVIVDEELNGRFYTTIKFPVFINSKPKYLAGYTIDITERKIAENALQASERRFKELIKNSSDSIVIMDENGIQIYVSDVVEKMLGFKPSELVNIPVIKKFIHPDDQKHTEAAFLKILQEGEGGAEYRHIHKDGTYRYLEAWGTNQLNNPDIRGIVVNVRDITNRKIVEESLRESEERFRIFINSSYDALFIHEPDGKIVDVNKTMLNMYSVTYDEALSYKIEDYIGPENLMEETHKLWKLTLDGKDQFFTWQARRPKDGTLFYVEVYLSKVIINSKPLILANIRDITKRKIAEKSLKDSELLLSESQKIGHIGSWSLDLQTKKLIWSDEAYRIFGLVPHEIEMTYETFLDFVHPEDKTIVDSSYFNSIKFNKNSYEIEHRIILKQNNEIRYLLEKCQHERDIKGAIIQSIGIVQDITERKLAERELLESEARFKALHNASFGGIAIHDKGIILECNLGLSEMMGYSIQELIGMDGLLLVSEKSRDLVLKNILSGYEKPYEAIGVRKNGEEFPIRLESRNIPYKGKKVRTTEFRDITEQKRSEAAIEKRIIALTQPLENIEDLSFEDLFNVNDLQKLQDDFSNATGVASIITRTDGVPITKPSNFTFFCSEIIRKTEKGCINCYKSDALIGRLSNEGPTVQKCISGGLWDAGAGISVGGKHIANWLIGQVRDETEKDENIIAYANEIGVEKEILLDAYKKVPSMSKKQFTKVAKALFTLASQLSTTAYQNVQQARFIDKIKKDKEEKEKLQSQLLHSQKMESVGRLAGGVAHDFNNMLTVILGYTNATIEQLDSSDNLNANLQQILNAAERSAKLTKQLLTFARKQIIEPKVLDLNATINQMTNMLSRLIGENIDLLFNPGKNIGYIKFDPSQIDQIIINLCVNAKDAITGIGNIIIETSTAIIDEAYCLDHTCFLPGEFVVLSVSDDGCGMNKETLQNIFEPFFTTKEIGEGTGLGLATVYGIVNQNNGFINVYSEENKGTTLNIYLPKHNEKVSLIKAKNIDEIPKGNNETILIAEDEIAILDMLSKIIKSLGYSVIKATKPSEAIKIAETYNENEINILITDVVMPEMNGRELAKRLNKLHKNMKCLFMSGYTYNVIAHQGVLDEGVYFIQKPFSKKEIANKLFEILNKE